MKFFNLKKIINPIHHESEEKSEKTMIAECIKDGLVILGAWPGITAKNGFYLLFILCFVSFIFQLWNALNVISDLDELMKNLETTIAVFASLVKVTSFQVKHRRIKIVIQDLLHLWTYTNSDITRKVMIKNSGLAKNIVNIYVGAYNALAGLYIIIALVSYNIGSSEDRRFILRSNFPLSHPKKSPFFETISVFHIVVVYTISYGNIVVDGLLITLVLHAKTKVCDLSQEIFKFSTICQKNYDRKIKLCTAEILINKHVNYIEYTEYLQDIFSMVSLALVFVCTLINVGVGYIFVWLLENNASFIRLVQCFLYINCALISVASYCIAGEYLKAQSYEILENLQNCPWYEFQSADIKLFLFMIIKAQKPVTITVGKFDDLSLIYFTTVIKTSFSYFSLLRAMRS